MSKPRRSLRVTRNGGAGIEDNGLLWLLDRIEQRARLASPMRATGLHDTLDDIAGGIALTEWVPGESIKGLTSGGISCSEISDLGERDTDRIPTLDVTGLFARL